MNELKIPAYRLSHEGRQLLDTPKLTVPRGQILAVTGPSGAGKSLWLRSLFGWSAKDMTPCLRHQNGDFLLIQDPSQGLTPGLSLRGHFAEVCPKDRWGDIEGLLQKLGFHDTQILDRGVHTFSGGERQRLMLALCLIQNPKVLVCDEPAASLDPDNETRLWQTLEAMRPHLTLIFVTHRLGLIEKYADQVLLIEAGQIRFQGTGERFFSEPQTRYHEDLLQQYRSTRQPHEDQEPGGDQAPLFELDQLDLSFGTRTLFRDYHLKLYGGHWTFLLGPSGRGKTSLAKVMAGLLVPDRVRLRWQGKELAVRLQDRERASRHLIQYVFQHGSLALNPARTLDAQLREACDTPDELEHALKRLRLDHLELKRGPGAFSLGELQRFNLIRTLARRPKLIIGDELLSALDLGVRHEAIQWLDQYRQREQCCVVITAHEALAQNLPGQQMLVLPPVSGPCP